VCVMLFMLFRSASSLHLLAAGCVFVTSDPILLVCFATPSLICSLVIIVVVLVVVAQTRWLKRDPCGCRCFVDHE